MLTSFRSAAMRRAPCQRSRHTIDPFWLHRERFHPIPSRRPHHRSCDAADRGVSTVTSPSAFSSHTSAASPSRGTRATESYWISVSRIGSRIRICAHCPRGHDPRSYARCPWRDSTTADARSALQNTCAECGPLPRLGAPGIGSPDACEDEDTLAISTLASRRNRDDANDLVVGVTRTGGQDFITARTHDVWSRSLESRCPASRHLRAPPGVPQRAPLLSEDTGELLHDDTQPRAEPDRPLHVR